MKTSAILLTSMTLLTLLGSAARADEATTPDAAAARESFQNMSAEEKQAIKGQARTQAEAKRGNWQQPSPEEKQGKRDSVRSKMQQRRAWFGSSDDRPFGSRQMH